MKKLIFNPSNKKYYSEEFIKGFECGVERQFNSNMKEQEPKVGWIPVKTRPLTDEELRFYYDQYGNDNIPEYMLDCPLPEDGQEILITFQMKDGKRCVATDICVCDEFGYYLEKFDDFDGVIAWMPLPEPYKAESEETE